MNSCIPYWVRAQLPFGWHFVYAFVDDDGLLKVEIAKDPK